METCASVATWLLTGKHIEQAVWERVVNLALGGYLLANVGQKGIEKLADAVRARLEKPATPPST